MNIDRALIEYYRISPESLGAPGAGYGAEIDSSARIESSHDIPCRTGPRSTEHPKRLDSFRPGPGAPELPGDFTLAVEALRREHYRETRSSWRELLATTDVFRRLYYFVRPHLPDSARQWLQKAYFSDWRNLPFPAWPLDITVDRLHEQLLVRLMEESGINKIPFIWFWPEGATCCLIMTHDVETSRGLDFVLQLMDLDDAYALKASFQIIPEQRYPVSEEFIRQIQARGFEVNVHDLNHDGHLYRKRSEFLRRAAMINAYARKFDAEGFRAGAMYRNLDWYDAFQFSYDMSLPNVAHFEPKRGGCCTVMPYFIGNIVELPLTTIQDYALFHILRDYSIDLWKRQIALIAERNGLISFLAHPDYLIEARARAEYEELLGYLSELRLQEKIWAPLPREVARWWRARKQMRLVRRGDDWEIEGQEHERARIAYAFLDGERLRYEVAESASCVVSV